MAISTEEALSSYGYVYDIAAAIPELKGYLDQAIQAAWTPDKLTATIESSGWWKSNAETVRNLAISRAADPATYEQNMSYARNLVTLKANQLGRKYSTAQIDQLATQSLITNSSWDDQVLSNLVGNTLQNFNRGEGGSYQSVAAQLNDHFKQVAASYGVATTDGFLEQWMNGVQAGYNTVDGFESLMRARAKAQYPQLANQLDAGMTVKDVADPYLAQLAKTLEVPETSVTLSDPYVQKALGQRNADGTASTQPMWQFERALKDDPRYDKTTAARTDANSMMLKIGKDFGFAS